MKGVFRAIVVTLLRWEARMVLSKYAPGIVAVTGSVGKTSTKDAVYTVLSRTLYVRKSQKSFNSEIGVPLTILGCENAWYSVRGWLTNLWEGLLLIVTKNHYPRWLVLEVGADRPGDISSAASWLEPSVAVITCLPDVPVHVEYFDSPEAVAREKWTLAESLREDGILVLNFDDARLRARKKYARYRTYTYGFEDGADVRAEHVAITYGEDGKPAGMTFKVDQAGNSVPVTLPGVLGRQHIYPVLAAATVGMSQGLNAVQIGDALEDYAAPAGRMRIIPGMNGATIIDDSYNAAPASLYEALETLRHIETSGRKIVVLGDMLELGKYTASAHRHVGQHVAAVADLCVTVGVRMRHAREEAQSAGMKPSKIHEYPDATAAGGYLAEELKDGDVVLVKGSQRMRMEHVVAACMAEPERKSELLVRQDAAWQDCG